MRILIVEDDAVLADALTHALRRSHHAVDCLASGAAADNAVTAQDYDIIILDLGLPELDGFEVLRRLRARRKRIPVLILTARDGLHDRVHGLDLGADDYLTKPFELPELEARMRAVTRRAYGAADDNVTVGRLALDSAGQRVMLDGSALELSSREFRVLEMLMTRSGRVISKEALIQRLYGWDREVSKNVVEIYVHRVRKKLKSAGVNIRTVRGLGYLLEPVAPTGKKPR
jgi:two-component system, OmpR family, response regulator